MQVWQWVLLAFLVILPIALMVDFWGNERLTFRGGSRPRGWQPPVRQAPDDSH